ncbi:MAG: 2-hydroxyacid dehydrogenase [Microbacterium sp.]|uniref:2-hydroxyacid dehydrogenase n=1 Tax=Microbacterium sp. TaxID=51671 RepID=UPI003F9C92F0
MPHIAIAGDHFVTPTVFRAALEKELGQTSATFSETTLPWPHEPFGPIGDVIEASGSIAASIAALEGAQIAVSQMAPFTREVFAARPELQMVGICRGGPVNVDLAAATEAGVLVTFAPGRNAQAAAEFTIGLILAAMRRIPLTDAELKRGVWRGDYYAWENVGVELDGTTVGLVGYGAIGRIVARILQAFGSTVIAYDPYADASALAADGVITVELETLLQRSSVVSLHARLTPETKHIIDERALGLLPHGAVLVNAARGGLLDYGPLPDMLRSGRLGALALDVYDVEPPPADWPLFSAPNVVVSPHLAGATTQTATRAADIVARDVADFVAGRIPAHVANPEVLDVLQLNTAS